MCLCLLLIDLTEKVSVTVGYFLNYTTVHSESEKIHRDILS